LGLGPVAAFYGNDYLAQRPAPAAAPPVGPARDLTPQPLALAERPSALAANDPRPLVVLTSSRDASAFGPRLTAERVLGFIPKDELSGSALRAMVDAA